MLRVPETALRFDDLLGFTELRKAIKLMVMVYYSKSMLIKVSKGKRHVERHPGEPRHRF